MWVETYSNVLINLDNLTSMTTKVTPAGVSIIGHEGDREHLIALVNTKEEALKFMSKLMKESAAGKKFAAAATIVITVQNEE